jgi:hypothetical protein
MALAIRSGMTIEGFLHATPREIRATFRGHQMRFREAAKIAAFTAWQTVALMPKPRKFRMPNLQAMLRKFDEDGGAMDASQLRQTLIQWNKEIGGMTRVVPKGSIKRPF